MLAAVARKGRAAWSSLASPAGDCLEQLIPCALREGSRQFSSASARSTLGAARGLHIRHTLSSPACQQGALQVRHFSWAFWRTTKPAAPVEELPETPEIDLAAVDTIVDMAGPSTMDAATWSMIHSTAWPHTYAAEMALATFHDTFGLSWMVAIPVTVAVMRTSMAPFLILSQTTAHKMAKASPLMQDAQREMMMAMERGVPIKEAQEDYRATTQQILKEHKTGPLHMLYPILFQLPVFTGYYFALTAMCNAHLPSMVVDAAPYGFDLTMVDPYHALNVSVPATLMAVGYLGMSNKWNTLTPAQQTGAKWMIVIAPAFMTAMFWSFPSALCYYWMCSNLYTIAFELVFRIPAMRAAVGLPSIAEQMELALENQKRANASGGGLMGLLGMYQKGAEAAGKQMDGGTPAVPTAGKPSVPSSAGASPLASSALSRASRKRR